jgi:hypothetical protein
MLGVAEIRFPACTQLTGDYSFFFKMKETLPNSLLDFKKVSEDIPEVNGD